MVKVCRISINSRFLSGFMPTARVDISRRSAVYSPVLRRARNGQGWVNVYPLPTTKSGSVA